MGNRLKETLIEAKRQAAKAESRYQKAVAKGERQVRAARAEAEERVARAKAEFNLRSSELAAAELALAEKERAKMAVPKRETASPPQGATSALRDTGNGAPAQPADPASLPLVTGTSA